MANLVVILGAGASYDCTSGLIPDRREPLRPPLVTQLFEPRTSFTQILHQYPRAEAAAADIRPTLTQGSVALEAFLRTRLRESPHVHQRLRYLAIPLYLQHLFFEIGRDYYETGSGYTGHPDNYDRLISAALELDEVVFATLNYDDLFDKRLFNETPLTSMESYLGSGQKWALIKLHGSVNWGRAVINSPQELRPTDRFLAATFAAVGEDVVDVEETITLRLQDTLLERRIGDEGGLLRLYYPALSAPLGSEDELVCLTDHQNYLRQRLRTFDGLNVLVIGYSGLDQEVMRVFAESGNELRSLYVVNGNEERGLQAAANITQHIRARKEPYLFRGGFTDFAQVPSHLPDYIASLD